MVFFTKANHMEFEPATYSKEHLNSTLIHHQSNALWANSNQGWTSIQIKIYFNARVLIAKSCFKNKSNKKFVFDK